MASPHAKLLKKGLKSADCPLAFLSSDGKPNYRFLHELCKDIATRAKLNAKKWHLHRFRDTAATRWLRAGVEVRTV